MGCLEEFCVLQLQPAAVVYGQRVYGQRNWGVKQRWEAHGLQARQGAVADADDKGGVEDGDEDNPVEAWDLDEGAGTGNMLEDFSGDLEASSTWRSLKTDWWHLLCACCCCG